MKLSLSTEQWVQQITLQRKCKVYDLRYFEKPWRHFLYPLRSLSFGVSLLKAAAKIHRQIAQAVYLPQAFLALPAKDLTLTGWSQGDLLLLARDTHSTPLGSLSGMRWTQCKRISCCSLNEANVLGKGYWINRKSPRMPDCCSLKCELLSRVQLFATPWTVAHQVPLSIEFSRQEYWRG